MSQGPWSSDEELEAERAVWEQQHIERRARQWPELNANEGLWMERILIDLDRLNRLHQQQTGRKLISAVGLPLDHETVSLFGLPIVRCDTDVPFLMIEVGRL